MPHTTEGRLEYIRMEYMRLAEDLRSLNNLWLALFGFFITVNTLLLAAVAFSYGSDVNAGPCVRTFIRVIAAAMGLFMSVAAAITVSSLADHQIAMIKRGGALEKACGAEHTPPEPPPAFAGIEQRHKPKPLLTLTGSVLFAAIWIAVLVFAFIRA